MASLEDRYAATNSDVPVFIALQRQRVDGGTTEIARGRMFGERKPGSGDDGDTEPPDNLVPHVNLHLLSMAPTEPVALTDPVLRCFGHLASIRSPCAPKPVIIQTPGEASFAKTPGATSCSL